MAQEIERKFLVLNDSYKSAAIRLYSIKQGYLSSDPKRSVRIRMKDDSGFITVKGASDPTGISRHEWEKPIPVKEAEELLKLCEPGMIEKIRYEVECGKHLFEVDEFLHENLGLVVAEIELRSPDEDFLKPDWLGREVTGELKYYNSQLSKRPFKTW